MTLTHCANCGEPIIGPTINGDCETCNVHFGLDPGTDDFNRRLADGFALMNAAEDDEIDPSKHIG